MGDICAEVLTLIGQFACKRVPVGDDHAWLEKGTFLEDARGPH